MIVDAVFIALRGMRSNKMRTMLTALGNIIAVAALVIVVAMVQGINAEVSRAVLSSGADVFSVDRYGLRVDEAEWEEVSKRPPVTAADADALRRDGTLIAHVLTTWRLQAPVRSAKETVESVMIEAQTSEYPWFMEQTVESGRHFTEMEDRRGVAVAVLGSDVAAALFPTGSGLGQTVRIDGCSFTVIGVMQPKGALLGQPQDRYAIVPLGAARRNFGRPWSVQIAVKPAAPNLLEQAADEARAILRAHRGLRPSDPDPFDLLSAATYLRMYRQNTRVTFAALIGLVGLALVVGGIVIANVMLMVVAQRTREIGIRKAVGAHRGQILAQFLVESATLSLVGGLLGFALGAGVTRLIAAFSPVPFAIEPWSVVLGLVMVVVVGVVAGLYPAARAARMKPVQALQYER